MEISCFFYMNSLAIVTIEQNCDKIWVFYVFFSKSSCHYLDSRGIAGDE